MMGDNVVALSLAVFKRRSGYTPLVHTWLYNALGQLDLTVDQVIHCGWVAGVSAPRSKVPLTLRETRAQGTPRGSENEGARDS